MCYYESMSDLSAAPFSLVYNPWLDEGIEFSLNLKFNSDLVDLPDLLDLLDLSDLSDLSPIRSAIFRKK